MLQNIKQTKDREERILEIHIIDGESVLLLSIPEIKEIIEKIGQTDFEFTPYCG